MWNLKPSITLGGFYVIEEQVFYYLLWKPTDNPQQFPPSRFMRVLALFFYFFKFFIFPYTYIIQQIF